MKQLLFALSLFVGFVAVPAAASANPSIKFDALEIDYGKIKKGANGVREFKFKNVGIAPLVIQDSKSSCGCLVPTSPKAPLMPGESGVIKAKYDTQRLGLFTKYVMLTTNDPSNPEVKLTVVGEVVGE